MELWNSRVSDAFPLTAMQSAILNQSLQSKDVLYIEQLVVEIKGDYHVEYNQQAWQAVVDAHPALRTRLYYSGLNEPHQVVLKPSRHAIPWTFHDFRNAAFDIHQYAEQDKAKGVELENAPLWRVAVFQVADDHYYMLVTVHHLIIDGWSFGVLAKELAEVYASLSASKNVQLPPAPSLAHHIKRVSLTDSAATTAFWRDKLKGFEVGKGLDAQQGHSGSGQASIEVLRSKAWRDELQAGCQALAITESSLFQSACSLVLARWTHDNDVVLGMTTVMRSLDQYDESRILGPLLNTLPQAWRFDWSQSCSAYLKARHQELSASFQHNQLPLSDIMAAANWEAGLTPFQVLTVFQYEGQVATDESSMPFQVSPVLVEESVGYPMAIYAWPGESFKIQLRYEASRWSPALITVLADAVCDVMVSLVRNGDQPLGELTTSVSSPPSLASQSETPPPLVGQRLRELVSTQPESIFMEDAISGQTFSYAAAWHAIMGLKVLLAEHGVKKGQVVACFSRNEPQSILQMLAVMEIGACYLGLDVQYPEQRVMDMLSDSGADLLLFHKQLPFGLNDYCLQHHIRVINVAEACTSSQISPSVTVIERDDVAYMIYTSGTTGKPKASLNTHDGLASRLAFLSSTMISSHRLLQCSGMSFDAVVLEVLMLLSSGGTLVFDDIDSVRNPQSITTLIQLHRITMMFLPPALLTHVALNDVKQLSWVGVGGDRCPPALAKAWAARGQFYNFYGPSEASIFCVVNAVHDTHQYDSIGLALPDVQLELVDQCGQPVPAGVSGELLIGGVGVAKGYHHRASLSLERFVSRPGSMCYRSGDQCQRDDDGMISILGRLDAQIKIRGVRVELSELEQALAACRTVKEARVIPSTQEGQVEALHAFYLTEDNRPISSEVLRQDLSLRLPNAVIPSTFTSLPAWPLTANNKIDLTELAARIKRKHESLIPGSDIEQQLVSVLEHVLQSKVTSLADSFFAIGGSSLQVAQCVSQLREVFGVEVAMNEFYQLPSMQALADWLQLRQQGHEPPLADIVTQYDLDEESVLAPDIDCQGLPLAKDGDWLLTGATGFVGAHLCASILRNTSKQVVCLVRAQDALQGLERVKRQLMALKLWCDEYQGRMSIVVGDLSLPQLGLSADSWDRLAQSVSHIVHCGAWVNFAYPYGLLKQANVEATRSLLELASTSTHKSMDFVSTMSLLSAASDLTYVSESTPMPNWPYLIGGYNQSKWVAEQLCLQAQSRGIDVSIYRLASMAGDQKTGINNEKDIIWRSVQACDLLGAYPESGALADLTMTDEVADVLVRAKVDAFRRPVWHMNQPEPVSWSSLYQQTYVKGKALSPLAASLWREALLAKLDQYPELSNLVPYTVEDDEVARQVPLVADCCLTQGYIDELGLSLSAVDPVIFSQYAEVLTPIGPKS
ncbi:thioester reductase domain-containing protein [Vibrio sp. M260112]|uniref:thioester reductase domain-containing protein n=1 Tax=Vibrio sp. M260112 TaxID=3020895 RepID=UPI002F40B411